MNELMKNFTKPDDYVFVNNHCRKNALINAIDREEFFIDMLNLHHFCMDEVPKIARAEIPKWVDAETGWPTVGNRKKINNGERPKSICLGVRKSGKDLTEPIGNSRYSELWSYIQQIHDKHFGQWHTFNQCNILYNTKFSKHKDRPTKNNETLMIGFGDYKGGCLKIKEDVYNINHQPILFNGNANEYEDMDYEGNKFVILFNTI